jgi:hypothetical protein
MVVENIFEGVGINDEDYDNINRIIAASRMLAGMASSRTESVKFVFDTVINELGGDPKNMRNKKLLTAGILIGYQIGTGAGDD